MSLALPRMRTLLGVDRVPDDIDEPVLQALTAAHVSEDTDLDFKAKLWTTGALGASECAKDCAAFANTLGGLIIVGVTDPDRHAGDLRPVPLSPVHERTIRQVLAQRISPPLTGVEIEQVRCGTDGEGAYVIAIPRSDDAPHCVLLDATALPWDDGKTKYSLLYPVRNGPDTRYLREFEVATRYRERGAIRENVEARLLGQLDTTVSRLRGGPDTLLLLAAAPTIPGQATKGSAGLNQADEYVRTRTESGPSGGPDVAHGRHVSTRGGFLFGQSPRPDDRPDSWEQLRLSHDGAGLAAVALSRAEYGVRPSGVQLTDTYVDAELLEQGVLGSLWTLAGWAQHTGAGGSLLVRARLTMRGPQQALLARNSIGQLSVNPGSLRVHNPPDLETREFPLLALGDDPHELVAAAAGIATDLLADFAAPETWLLGLDGTFKGPPGPDQTSRWAAGAGLFPTR